MEGAIYPTVQNDKQLCICCYKTDCEHLRPPEPPHLETVMYRGWEVTYDADAAYWSKCGWRAYKGGVDLDAPHVDAATYSECLDAIDEEEA